MDSDFEDLKTQFANLTSEFEKFQKDHREYIQNGKALVKLQNNSLKEVKHHKYRLNQVENLAENVLKNGELSDQEVTAIHDLQAMIARRKIILEDMSGSLPKTATLYLRLILGNLNVSLMSKEEKFQYKEEYEKFKVYMTVICTTISFIALYIIKYRFMDALFHFLLVWYYCTVTIRETILRCNGSRIKTWWISHHYISTVVTGIMVTWPDSPEYQIFRTRFLYFCLYLGFVQYVQYKYQREQLYKLRALGESKGLEVTVEGFSSWMWRGMRFLIPMLFLGYAVQLYLAWTLWKLGRNDSCNDWQVVAISLLFLVLALGNILSTLNVIWNKIQEPGYNRSFRVLSKFRPTGLEKGRNINFLTSPPTSNPTSPSISPPESRRESVEATEDGVKSDGPVKGDS